MESVRVEALPALWRAQAEQIRPYNGGAAEAFERAALELEQAQRSEAEELLTLVQAHEVSGLTADHLGRLIRQGKLKNCGRHNAPLIRRGDLPHKRSFKQGPTKTQKAPTRFRRILNDARR